MENSNLSEVVVIGGGIAGVSAALELAKDKDTSVILIEKKHLFWGSSGRNPGRMGHGFHYMDIETAKMYLHASVAVQRNYPDFLIGKDLPVDHPVRHGRYFVTKNSLYKFDQVMESYRALQTEYATMVQQDPANEVFGPPEKFLRVLDVHEYSNYVNPDSVEGAVETAEHLFNWPEFSKHIRQLLEDHPRIRIYENMEVTYIHPRISRTVRFQIDTLSNSPITGELERFQFRTNFIINSSWENIDLLNESAGVSYINRMRTNRLKCLLVVKLPESLVAVNSSFFCMGSFCMFSNMGDGRGMMTLADVTNMATSFSKEIDANMKRYVNGDVSIEEKHTIGQEILQGIAKYIPDMARAEFIDVMFGIVQTKGELNLSDLLDKKSAHHVRNYHGIREEYHGLISNPAMKLFYFIENATMVREFFDKQIKREKTHQKVFNLLTDSLFWNYSYNKKIIHTIFFIVDRMMLDEDEEAQAVVNCMTTIARAKQMLHAHIHSLNDIAEALKQSYPWNDDEENNADEDHFDISFEWSECSKKRTMGASLKSPPPLLRSVSCDIDKFNTHTHSLEYNGIFQAQRLPERPKSTSACFEKGFEECKSIGVSQLHDGSTFYIR